ncbi:hypothetical protein WG66_002187 [Moniliophthora roreri]|nr:hypothetical protein WG66_002187 [Moniliophthora roreri]
MCGLLYTQQRKKDSDVTVAQNLSVKLTKMSPALNRSMVDGAGRRNWACNPNGSPSPLYHRPIARYVSLKKSLLARPGLPAQLSIRRRTLLNLSI